MSDPNLLTERGELGPNLRDYFMGTLADAWIFPASDLDICPRVRLDELNPSETEKALMATMDAAGMVKQASLGQLLLLTEHGEDVLRIERAARPKKKKLPTKEAPVARHRVNLAILSVKDLNVLIPIVAYRDWANHAVPAIEVFRALNHAGKMSPAEFATAIERLEAAGAFDWTLAPMGSFGEGLEGTIFGIDRDGLLSALCAWDNADQGAKA